MRGGKFKKKKEKDSQNRISKLKVRKKTMSGKIELKPNLKSRFVESNELKEKVIEMQKSK